METGNLSREIEISGNSRTEKNIITKIKVS